MNAIYTKKMTKAEYIQLKQSIYLNEVVALNFLDGTATAYTFANDERAVKILERNGFQEGKS